MIASVETIKTTEINIHEILDEVVTLLEMSEETAGLSFFRVYDPSLPSLRGDRNGLLQVFLNILKNAVEASPENGEIIDLVGTDSVVEVPERTDEYRFEMGVSSSKMVE